MKNLFKTAASIGVSLLISGSAALAFAHAEDEVAQETRRDAVQERRTEIRDTRQETRENIQQKRQDVREKSQEVRKDVREKVQDTRKEIREKAQGVREGVREKAEGVREELKMKRDELKQNLEAKRKEAKERLETVREEAKMRVKATREELKKKIDGLRDEKKKERAKRLDEQLNRLNERWTTHFTNVLSRLESVLGKIKIRKDKAASLGKDLTAVDTAIAAAESVIASTRSAVEAQAQKDYTVTFTSEEQLKEAFRAAKKQLHQDLTSLRDGAMKSARNAVHDVQRALAGVPKVDEEPAEGTTTSTSQ